jgi:hypothetical protein
VRLYQIGWVMRKYIYISVLTLVILLILAFSRSILIRNGVVRNINAHVIQPKSAGTAIPPPLEALGQGARLPTAQELEQEKKFNAQQVELASRWLKSPDAHQRIIGAEQLSAYDTPESEQYLAATLHYDADPEVRKTAAQSLSSFKNFSDPTIEALLEALGDTNESTRIATLYTVFSYALVISPDPKKSRELLTKVRGKVRSGHLESDVRENLQTYIKAQEPQTNAFFSPPSQTNKINR